MLYSEIILISILLETWCYQDTLTVNLKAFVLFLREHTKGCPQDFWRNGGNGLVAL